MSDMKRRNSIRWRLPLSYAAIALLTVLALGGVLLVTLRSYYEGLERAYLMRNAVAVASIVGESIQRDVPPAALQAQIESLAFFSRARIRLLDRASKPILDSGHPIPAQPFAVRVEERTGKRDVAASGEPSADGDIQYFWSIGIAPPGETAGVEFAPFGQSETVPVPDSPISPRSGPLTPGNERHDVLMVLPATDTFYGFDLGGGHLFILQRSNVAVNARITDGSGKPIGMVELSEGPAYGRDILATVAGGLALAGLVAVVVSGGAGWIVSRRISDPLLRLTETTSKMAEGDLSARSSIERSDEIGMLAQSYNEMAAHIQEMVVALRQIVTDAAHELHTPLTALHTNLEMIADETNPNQRALYLERALVQLQRFETMTGNLLMLSQLEAGVLSVEKGQMNLNQLLKEIGEIYASRAEQAGLTFLLDVPSESISVEGSESQLHRAVGNLLENAVKFTSSGGNITLRLKREGDTPQIEVEDTGIGITAEDLPRLFERFHRGRNAAGYTGSGLGLAITRAIIRSHGGDVEVENGEKGSRFVITLG